MERMLETLPVGEPVQVNGVSVMKWADDSYEVGNMGREHCVSLAEAFELVVV